MNLIFLRDGEWANANVNQNRLLEISSLLKELTLPNSNKVYTEVISKPQEREVIVIKSPQIISKPSIPIPQPAQSVQRTHLPQTKTLDRTQTQYSRAQERPADHNRSFSKSPEPEQRYQLDQRRFFVENANNNPYEQSRRESYQIQD